ncbi:hypothetical protein [Pseudonocardia sp. N23]|uniref:hypothetical protein n=1 Tax=Pseudonocardia sp. N23 TaxID=1987376 RepID=UPI000BFD6D22|nr:hypothetical protein [Pseudonocardia sp. N23]GAY08655.1 putative integral membrane protein [Pseudonocardia sp. N23]
MIGALVIVVYVATGLLAVYGLVRAVQGRHPGRDTRVGVGIVEALLVVQAAIAAFRVLGGGTALPEQGTFLIYLVVSICVLPIGLQFAVTEPTTRWGGAVVAVAAIGTGVAVWRLAELWAAGSV